MKPKLLLVDDNHEFRKMLKEFLEKQPIEIEIFEAYTGEMGLAKSSFVNPDIIIMDISLPGANGIQSAKHIKNDHPDCEIIILTMFNVDEFKRIAHDINVAAFIGKSDLYDNLVPAIQKCIDKFVNH